MNILEKLCKDLGKKVSVTTREVKPFSALISLDKEQVDFGEQFDGVTVIVTSGIHMSDEKMMSPRRLINAFNSAIAFEIKTGVYYVQASEDLKELLKVLNINWNNSFVRYEDLNNFAKDWCTTN